MYKCGWNGCEKAYGTLNHLNAHVTMQSHGTKRTPEGMHFYCLIPFLLWLALRLFWLVSQSCVSVFGARLVQA
jgi:transcription factor CON7